MRNAILAMLAIVLLSIVASAEQLTDPYEVLNRQFKALGGLDALQAETTSYMTADIELVGTGLSGTIKAWNWSPSRSREEIDLGIFQSTQGDDGTSAWEQDANGKVRVVEDEASVKRRQVSMLINQYRYADPKAPEFKLELTGTDTANSNECYLLKLTNTINDDVRVDYINTASFLPEKTIETQPDEEVTTWYSDYRDVNGVLHAFHQDMFTVPGNQRISLTITSLETNLPLQADIFEPPNKDVADFTIVDSAAAANVPFEYIEGHIFLPVTINCEKRLWVLDSGAGSTVLLKHYANELGLQLKGNITGQGAGNSVEVSFVKIPAFSLPGLEFSAQNAVAIEMQDLLRKMDLDVVGILGYDFLSRFVTRIDYANERLSFYDPTTFSYQGDGVVLPAALEQHTPTVPMTVDGKYSGQWRLDTGAGSCAFHRRFALENHLDELPGVEWMGTGAGGTLLNRVCRFQQIEFADFQLPKPLLTVTVQESEGAFNWSELTGNIGNSLLSNFVIWLDYADQQVIVERGDNFGQGFAWDRSGLQLLRDSDTTAQAYYVVPGSPAASAGLRTGDRIRSVNGVGLELFADLNSMRQLFRAPVGTGIEISFLRDDKTQSCSFKLVDLI